MKMKEITAKLMALALCGCMTCSFAACGSSGNTSFKGEKSASSSQSQDKGDEKSDTTALSKTPEYEIQKGDFKSIMDIYAQVSDDKSGAIHYGKYYDLDDYKIFPEDSRDDLSSFSDYTYNAASYRESSDSTTPENDKNIMYLRYGCDYALELPDTGDVFEAFMSGNGKDLICLSSTRVRAINTDDGSVTWESKAPDGSEFIDNYNYDYSRNSKLVIYASGEGFMSIDLQNGNSKILTATGTICQENGFETPTVENASNIFYNVIVCGDKYLCKTNIKGILGADIYVVIDEDGNILLSSAEIGYTETLYDVESDKIWIDDAAYAYNGTFMFKLGGSNDEEFYDDGVSPNSGLIWLQFDAENLYLEPEDYIASEHYMYNTCYTPYVKGTVTQSIIGEGVGCYENNVFLNGSDYIMNAKTGQKLENASLCEYVGDHTIACDDYACIEKDNKKYVSNSDFELYEIPEKTKVLDFANDFNSEYVAYACSDQKLHYINKSTKEEKTIDTPYTKDTSSKTPTVTLNGDFIIYSSNDNTELHAFNTKTGKDSIVYSAKGDQFVKLTSDKKQNNWFIIGNRSKDGNVYNFALLK